MDDLSELQRFIIGCLRRRRALRKDTALLDSIPLHVTGNDRLSPVEQLEIYREQFWLRHTSSLLEDFPGLSGILGQADWERLVEEYLESFVPDSYSLRDLGRGLPDCVARATWLEHHELCIDMARLEWAYIEAFDAADREPIDAQRLTTIPEEAWPTARIELAPSVRLLTLRYPVIELRRKLRENKQTVPIPEPELQRVAVYRTTDRNLRSLSLAEPAFVFISELARGVALMAACQTVVQSEPTWAATLENELGGWFQDWGQRGLIVDVAT